MILDFDYIYDKYDLNISGIIHIGGHYGREIDKYKSHNVNDIVLFEPLTSNFSVLNDIAKNTEGNIIAHQVALGNDNRKVTMNISSNEAQSSSILTPKVHLTAHPEVTFSGTEEVEMRKLDDYDYQDYNMIVVDVQGYELEVLRGASQTLSNIDYIYCEVNRDEVYEDNARVEEIDEFLSSYGFKRVETQWYYTGVWGDALYIKNKLNNFPTVYYTSLKESLDRQKNITEQFQKYGITPIPIISKRFAESDDIITGKYLHQLNDGTKGCCVSHLKAIKQWYDNTKEEYGFFCEDDLSLETVQYWNFTWEEFIEKVPKDFECFQLLTIRANFDNFELRERYWDDWGATAYIVTRDYAKKIIDTYIKDGTYHLEIPNNDIMPLIENILFSSIGKTYTIPLFVENTEFISTYQNSDDDDVNDGQKTNHKVASDFVLNYWKNIKNEQKKVKKMFIVIPNTIENEIEKLITNYSLDTENADNNFALGVWYENQGHTAPALSYYLRCAERAEDEDLAYEALIRGSYCYEKQGTRDESSRSMLWQAQAFLPHRPEAYFLLSRFAEKREWWQDCYLNADLALRYCRFDCKPLRTDVQYPGKYGLLFEKAVSGYWWGKDKECKEIFLDLIENHPLSDIYKKTVKENLKKNGIDYGYDPIPVIGVPIVNGFHWLQRLVDSIDYPVKELCVINNNGRGELIEELDNLSKISHKFIESIKICHLPANIGCSGAWNLIIKTHMMDPYWLMVSHDIAFPPGFLEEMVEKAKDAEYGVVKGSEGQWDMFILKDYVIQKCGLFDENFYPAYVEDCDYYIRTQKQNIRIYNMNSPYLHGEKNYETTGSQTWRTDISLKEKLDNCHNSNHYYMAEKWGSEWDGDNSDTHSCTWNHNPYECPYNDPSIPITYTSYDLQFVRSKNLGF
jgi:FkbM family methyltransferase